MSAYSVVFPDGSNFFCDAISSIQVSASTVSIGIQNNIASYSYAAADPSAAKSIAAQILASKNGIGPVTKTLDVSIVPYIITQIIPSSFDVTTTPLTIIGTGFDPDFAGQLRVEDVTGGTDSNGYYDTVTVAAPLRMTSVFTSPGDGILGPGPVLIYYQDTNGKQSNVINGTNPNDTIITIP